MADDIKAKKGPAAGKKDRKPVLRNPVRRFPLLTFAIILGAAMIVASMAFAHKVRKATGADFNPSKVLPQAVTPPASAANAVFTADTIKQYDGKDGHKCYVAVNGTVYEISGKSLWQNGQHTPSDGQAYCGADLTEAIKHSPHGVSKLQELPKVGVFK